ncbi:MAG TPA: di-heme-cytochrome C peroxidase [Methylocystis sp.]|jgi:hypothetical protein
MIANKTLRALLRAHISAAAFLTFAAASPSSAAEPKYANQGDHWTPAERKEFYSLDQGSRIMPLDWFTALKRPDGSHFLDDGMMRYGYLRNPDSAAGLPVGFLVAPESKTLSMTCAACHTREIDVGGASWRIDGGPAIVDIQHFFADIDTSVDKVVNDAPTFAEFAKQVLGQHATEQERKLLLKQVADWFKPYHALMKESLPPQGWGVGRLDAVSMIFNRVSGLDIGTSPDHIILENIKRANAPVRYPFLWNAPVQDMTQWPGFAENGNGILGLARNVGEVYGVFGVFHPRKDVLYPDGVEYLSGSSLNMPGLMRLETLIRQIEPPKWQWAVDKGLADAGKKIYDRECGANCHEINTKDAAKRLCAKFTWKTPIQDVGTDVAEYAVVDRVGKTGVLEGQLLPKPPFNQRLKREGESQINILTVAVVQSILRAPIHFRDIALYEPLLQECLENESDRPDVTAQALRENFLGVIQKSLATLYQKPDEKAPPAYEARVMQGIWAAAPYLHNGSVPTLADLLKKPADRPASFKVGPAYDIENVGLAKEQTKFDDTYATTARCDPKNRDASGNSRCGHDFGTSLSDPDKKALLEYLKSL